MAAWKRTENGNNYVVHGQTGKIFLFIALTAAWYPAAVAGAALRTGQIPRLSGGMAALGVAFALLATVVVYGPGGANA